MRLGYKDLSELMDGYSWSYRYDSAAHKLVCNGSRVTYMVHQPIVDAKGELIHNHFPIRPMGTPTIMFTDRDSRFFATT